MNLRWTTNQELRWLRVENENLLADQTVFSVNEKTTYFSYVLIKGKVVPGLNLLSTTP
jgi:hypothetical protein